MLKEQNQISEKFREKLENGAQLILHNDDFNTFDFVIDTLVKVCGHTDLQAEQLALLIHHKGKAIVKKGAYNVLLSMYHSLTLKNLTAELVC